MGYKLPNIEDAYHIEFIRKGIHLCSLSIPIIYFFITRDLALKIIIPITLAFLIVDIARYYHSSIQKWYYKSFGFLLRSHESDKVRKRLTGATYVLIAATICIIVFPKIITVTCFSVLIIADLTAALIGRQFGRRQLFNKTLEGSLAFFTSGIIVIIVAPKIEYIIGEYLIGIFAVAVGTIIEMLPIKIDDNLSIPISVGATLWALYYFFFPMLNIFIYG